MYLKFNFTAGKPLQSIFRAVNEIINNSDITSIATLQSTATAGGWHSSILATLDPANSEIVRTGTGNTALTSNTKSHYTNNFPSGTYEYGHSWTVEFSTYDNLSRKYYVQHKNTAGASSAITTSIIGTSLTSGSMSSGGMAPTVSNVSTSGGGTSITLGGTTQTSATYAADNSSSSFLTVTTFVMYISDTAMIWSATCGATYNVGFGPTYNDPTKYIGPYIFSQYNRFDYHNTDSNNIIPLAYTNPNRANSAGFGYTTADWSSSENTMATSQLTQTFKVLNLVNSYPSTNTSFPIITFPTVNWGVGSRYTDYNGLTASSAGSTSTVGTPAYGPALFTTVSTRFPSADLKALTYGMLPVSWRHSYYYNAGGDMSAKGGWYLFNGDYFPGDEYTYDNKTYKILPPYVGYSYRIGIAIPKE